MPERRGQDGFLRLLAWLSPAFPVGSFSYSHGLERAVHDDLVTDRATVEAWLVVLIERGSAWNDAVLFAEAWRAHDDEPALRELSDLGEALAGSQERHRETMLQGGAFLAATRDWIELPRPAFRDDMPYCIAVGAHAGASGVPLEQALAAYLQAFATTLVQAAIRLGVIGQTEAVATIGSLETTILATARRASASDLSDLGAAAFRSDIVSMTHETQYSRLFRT